MGITILAVGKKHERWVAEGIARYERRLRARLTVSWQLLSHSARAGDAARTEESTRILAKLDTGSFVVLLDERGVGIDSITFAATLQQTVITSRHLVFVIGGAYGVDARVRQRANLMWSLSPLVFPHQLVRLVLIEQLYRAQEITAGRPYHHE